jgi:hypothetical protein
MQPESSLEELIESACPSIRYRVRAEILGEDPSCQEMSALQEQILRDPHVQDVLSWQQPDGWLARDFHGAKGLEAGIRILCEKGLRAECPPLALALTALGDHPDRLERGIGTVGPILDELGFGGSRMIQATVYVYAGLEDRPCVQAQLDEALKGFRAVLEVERLDEIIESYRGRLVFKPGLQWPGIYHLRLLALTRSWRTDGNLAMLAAAVRRLVCLSPLPVVYVRSKSRWVAPASFCMQNFAPDLDSMEDVEWMKWFHRMECLARLGVVPHVEELNKQVEWLQRQLNADQGWFKKPLRHPYFVNWGAYTGLALEPDWRSPKNRVHDLTFRSRLILHYYENVNIRSSNNAKVQEKS